MAGAAPMAFGGLSNSYRSAPRHIPVRDVDAVRKKPEPLSGYMIDPRYVPHDDKGHPVPRLATTTGRSVPALIPLAAARSRAAPGTANDQFSRQFHTKPQAAAQGYKWPEDWRRVALPIAALLFIVGLGITDLAYQSNTPSTTTQTAQQPAKPRQTATSPSQSPSPSPTGTLSTNSGNQSGSTATQPPSSETSTVGGRGGGTTAQTQTSPTPSTLNPQPATSSGAPPTTTPATDMSGAATSTTPLVGGRGGGGDSMSIAPEPGLPTPPLLPGK